MHTLTTLTFWEKDMGPIRSFPAPAVAGCAQNNLPEHRMYIDGVGLFKPGCRIRHVCATDHKHSLKPAYTILSNTTLSGRVSIVTYQFRYECSGGEAYIMVVDSKGKVLKDICKFLIVTKIEKLASKKMT